MTLEHKMGENSGTDNMELEWHDTLKKTIDACSADTEGLRIRPGMNFTALSRTHHEDNWTHQEDNWTPEEPKLHYKEKDKLNNKPHNIDTNNENNNNNGARGGRNLAAAFANATRATILVPNLRIMFLFMVTFGIKRNWSADTALSMDHTRGETTDHRTQTTIFDMMLISMLTYLVAQLLIKLGYDLGRKILISLSQSCYASKLISAIGDNFMDSRQEKSFTRMNERNIALDDSMTSQIGTGPGPPSAKENDITAEAGDIMKLELLVKQMLTFQQQQSQLLQRQTEQTAQLAQQLQSLTEPQVTQRQNQQLQLDDLDFCQLGSLQFPYDQGRANIWRHTMLRYREVLQNDPVLLMRYVEGGPRTLLQSLLLQLPFDRESATRMTTTSSQTSYVNMVNAIADYADLLATDLSDRNRLDGLQMLSFDSTFRSIIEGMTPEVSQGSTKVNGKVVNTPDIEVQSDTIFDKRHRQQLGRKSFLNILRGSFGFAMGSIFGVLFCLIMLGFSLYASDVSASQSHEALQAKFATPTSSSMAREIISRRRAEVWEQMQLNLPLKVGLSGDHDMQFYMDKYDLMESTVELYSNISYYVDAASKISMEGIDSIAANTQRDDLFDSMFVVKDTEALLTIQLDIPDQFKSSNEFITFNSATSHELVEKVNDTTYGNSLAIDNTDITTFDSATSHELVEKVSDTTYGNSLAIDNTDITANTIIMFFDAYTFGTELRAAFEILHTDIFSYFHRPAHVTGKQLIWRQNVKALVIASKYGTSNSSFDGKEQHMDRCIISYSRENELGWITVEDVQMNQSEIIHISVDSDVEYSLDVETVSTLRAIHISGDNTKVDNLEAFYMAADVMHFTDDNTEGEFVGIIVDTSHDALEVSHIASDKATSVIVEALGNSGDNVVAEGFLDTIATRSTKINWKVDIVISQEDTVTGHYVGNTTLSFVSLPVANTDVTINEELLVANWLDDVLTQRLIYVLFSAFVFMFTFIMKQSFWKTQMDWTLTDQIVSDSVPKVSRNLDSTASEVDVVERYLNWVQYGDAAAVADFIIMTAMEPVHTQAAMWEATYAQLNDINDAIMMHNDGASDIKLEKVAMWEAKYVQLNDINEAVMMHNDGASDIKYGEGNHTSTKHIVDERETLVFEDEAVDQTLDVILVSEAINPIAVPGITEQVGNNELCNSKRNNDKSVDIHKLASITNIDDIDTKNNHAAELASIASITVDIHELASITNIDDIDTKNNHAAELASIASINIGCGEDNINHNMLINGNSDSKRDSEYNINSLDNNSASGVTNTEVIDSSTTCTVNDIEDTSSSNASGIGNANTIDSHTRVDSTSSKVVSINSIFAIDHTCAQEELASLQHLIAQRNAKRLEQAEVVEEQAERLASLQQQTNAQQALTYFIMSRLENAEPNITIESSRIFDDDTDLDLSINDGLLPQSYGKSTVVNDDDNESTISKDAYNLNPATIHIITPTQNISSPRNFTRVSHVVSDRTNNGTLVFDSGVLDHELNILGDTVNHDALNSDRDKLNFDTGTTSTLNFDTAPSCINTHDTEDNFDDLKSFDIDDHSAYEKLFEVVFRDFINNTISTALDMITDELIYDNLTYGFTGDLTITQDWHNYFTLKTIGNTTNWSNYIGKWSYNATTFRYLVKWSVKKI
eukprot:CAMPEP_0197322680 /NCGR_PEP_ID=MMETSP0891-20130614/70036_1 /TAXON_ID=44058 ORGANISM="Aureoumbra lagunensis, Strain CCMP1510" /NCGR_SAMPLE_ID=MMETSP0891 /ASSEMBLY_ACC=CAM_ASM_000534 /LENGTH=1648 /DNA_ID=CAMNT_0042815131 /DNA_START=2404 /DNA_END=7350 /DNA_ORIENTATION=-